MAANRRLYRHKGKALLRATPKPGGPGCEWWPDLTGSDGPGEWQAWLLEVWSDAETAEGITIASPPLAQRVDKICAGDQLKPKDVRRAVAAVVRYLLRRASRPTPFGLFAGVAPVMFGPAAKIRWGSSDHPVARADTEWLAEVIARLEAVPELLERLPLLINNLRSVRGDWLVLPEGVNRVEVRYTAAVRAVERAAATPIRFRDLEERLAGEFPATSLPVIRAMLTELVSRRFLLTALRPPLVVTSPLRHVIDQLRQAGADQVSEVAPLVRELCAIQASLDHHNRTSPVGGKVARASLNRRMRSLSPGGGRTPLAVDLWLDCDLELPHQIGDDIEAAASALLRLSTQPNGKRAWRDYHAAFLDRYGVGTVVPLTTLVNPELGLGFPAGYPGSLLEMPEPPSHSERDERLLALVQQAALSGDLEIVLDDETISWVAGDMIEAARIPSHVELSARIQAPSRDALDRGEYRLTVSPGRAAGTMSGRFAPEALSGLGEVFRDLPPIDPDAIAAQLSFPPVFAHAENVARTPQFLPYLITLGEHQTQHNDTTIVLSDLGVTADWDRLSVMSLSKKRPVEAHVFHALRLDKQLPHLARFLINLPRGSAVTYTEFDWGSAARLPYLPRVRYGRAYLSPAQWRISRDELPSERATWPSWRAGLSQWQRRWSLPNVVELRDEDRVLRLDLGESAHAALLRTHLSRADEAVLTEAAEPADLGWADCRAHEIVVPLVRAGDGEYSPHAGRGSLVIVDHERGHLPGGQDSTWLFAKVHAHPERQEEIIASYLPRLMADLGDDRLWWFIRYRTATEPDHLRLRVHVAGPDDFAKCMTAIGAWSEHLRQLGIVARLVIDTYEPEVGRYGDGTAMVAAEEVFAADSAVVAAQLRHFPEVVVHRSALIAANITSLTCGFLGTTQAGFDWLIDHKTPAPEVPTTREVLHRTIDAVLDGALEKSPGWPAVAPLWEVRHATLRAYHRSLPNVMNMDRVLESILHMHHIRAAGLDRDYEYRCRRLARNAALAWQARARQR